MSEEELININGIREDLYQAMQIGDITLNSKHSQELYDFMNYQDKEIERLNNIINELEKYINNEWNAIEKEPDNSFYDGYDTCIEEMKKDILDKLQELKGSE